MIRRILLLILSVFSLQLHAQPEERADTAICVQEEMKKIFVVRKSETVTPVQPPLIVTENKEEVKSSSLKKADKQYRSKPTLSSDQDGLLSQMKLEPLYDLNRTSKTESYVVFSFSVNQWGFVSEINIYDTNDRPLVDILIQKLDKTRWRPAVDMEGNKTDYSFGNWIAKIPAKVKPREYEDYRF